MNAGDARRNDRRVIPSVLEGEPEAAERGLEQARADCPLVELRADLLRAGEVGGLVRRSRRELVVSARRGSDGGRFCGSEEERRGLLLAALEAGARYVDIERDEPPLDRRERSRFARRIVLSDHGCPCEPETLERLYAEMAAGSEERIKIVPRAQSVAQISAVRELLGRAERDGRLVACFALGRQGALSRLLAPSWGSWATYGAPRRGAESADGQFTVDDMIDVHDVLGIGERTRRFLLVGSRVFGSPSPAMHAAAYAACGLDARYLPLELDDLDSLTPLLEGAGNCGFEGLAVTMPLKESAAARCRSLEPPALEAGAVNTVLLEPEGWRGFNTDGPAVAALIRRHGDPLGARTAIVGAGGTARAAAVALKAEGAEVTLFNRTLSRARAAAERLGVDAQPLERLDGADWEILVNATPLGAGDEGLLAADRLRGRLVLDAVYRLPPTPLVAEARKRGLQVEDGLALLAEQAERQFGIMTDRSVEGGLMAAVGMQWLLARGA